MQQNIEILIISHSLLIDSYRKLYRMIANDPKINITIITPFFWKESGKWTFFQPSKDDKNIKVIKDFPIFFSLFKPLLNLTLIYPRAIYFLLKYRFDVVHIIEEPYSISAFLTTVIIRALRLKTKIICFSAQNLYKKMPFPFSFFEKIVIKKSDMLFPLTKDVSYTLRKKGSKKPHHIIPLGFDDTKDHKEQFQKNNEKYIVGFLGRLEPFKGLDLFLKLANKYINKDIEFVVAGQGSYIKKVKNNPNIKYLGFIENKNIKRFYSNIDLLLVPSITTDKVKEQFGRVVIEAIANNCPVLVSDSGELPNIVRDDIFIFKEKNFKSLDEKFSTLIQTYNSPVFTKAFIDLQSIIYKKYSYSSIAEKIKIIYLNLI